MTTTFDKVSGLASRDGHVVGRVVPRLLSKCAASILCGPVWDVFDRQGVSYGPALIHESVQDLIQALPTRWCQPNSIGDMALRQIQRRDVSAFNAKFRRLKVREAIAEMRTNMGVDELAVFEKGPFRALWKSYREAVRETQRCDRLYRQQINADAAALGHLIHTSNILDFVFGRVAI